MRRFAAGLFVVTLMLLPALGQAQLFGQRGQDRADWALEASLYANYTEMAYSQLNDHITEAPEFYEQQMVYSGYQDVDGMDPQVAYDIRLGVRYGNVHVGGGYQTFGKQSGGYTLLQGLEEVPYSIELSAREFYAYAGYLYPVNDWLSLGPMVGFGFGFIEGTLTDPVKDAEGVNVEGTMTPLRLEFRGRARLTTYISVDIGVGYRAANSTDTEADYGVEGEFGIDGSKGPLQDYNGNAMEVEMSGWFVGGGITLLNPFN